MITESLEKGSLYRDIQKVISVSIVYFHLGEDPDDYLYYGKTESLKKAKEKLDFLKLSEEEKKITKFINYSTEPNMHVYVTHPTIPRKYR